ncbi:hypothetical protein [Variovorax sp. PBL-E5]|uniref:hypothetical protein n=1 Tax=Variovorax sp. PBL-E5 TaxID=434014 RepID=UPI0013194D19|nr:hypothetical protein [Variovorax sp. PBL-E5]VTU38138.1 hypothetical protein E5CHR_04744 [Variovorax sp. PBL-E5]
MRQGSLPSVLLIAACAISLGAFAQDAPRPAAPLACPSNAQDLPVDALYGTWEARFDGVPGVAMVQLAKHPDYAGVKGTITRGGDTPRSTAELAGDIDDDGVLAIDESQDGRTISGTWSGELQAGSCGREFRGTWRNAADDSTRSFVLNKTGSWQ